jgi:hypothetical protein
MKSKAVLLAITALGMYSAVWADTPFDGTWKLNTAKSRLAGDTMSFRDGGNGTLKYIDSSQSYSFKPDGSSFTTPLGIERTFQKNADGTYTTTNKKGGFLISTSTWKLSPDANSLLIDSTGTKPNGDKFENTTTYARTSPGAGLIGGWQSTDVKLSSPNSLTVQSNGNDVTLSLSAIKVTCHAKWDGKDYPANGPTVAENLTLAVEKTGPNGFKLVTKAKAKVLAIINYQVSDNGKTMTAKGTNGEGGEPFTQVWEKQS